MEFSRIERAVSELVDFLPGRRVEEIHQLDKYSFLFSLYRRGERSALLVSVKKGSERFHLVFERIHAEYRYSSPSTGQLSRYLVKGRIESLTRIDHVVGLRVGDAELYQLVVDFKKRNILLANEKHQVLFLLFEKGSAHILSGDNAQEGLHPNRKLVINRKLSREFIEERRVELIHRVIKAVESERKKLQRLLSKLHDERAEIERMELYREMGELIKYNLPTVERGMNSVCLTNFDGEKVTVALDPLLGPKGNMERYFRKYKKLKRRAQVIEQKNSYEEEKLHTMDDLIRNLPDTQLLSITQPPEQFRAYLKGLNVSSGFMERIEQVLREKRAERRDRRKSKREPFLRFQSRSGKTILVGRNARENEDLSIRMARGNDLWFHVESGPGSHVVLRYEKASDFQESDIIDALMLALYFSHYRQEKSGNVVYTYCKYLRKPKNTKEGYVTYYNSKTKRIGRDEKILVQLLDSKPEALMQIS